MNFECDTPQVKDCILETEEKLRNLVYEVMSRKYGPAWELDAAIGWANKKKESLENRRTEKKQKFPHQNLPERLIDYAYIMDLQNIVFKNKLLFNSVFSSWDKTMIMFEIVGDLRNLIMHNTEIPLHQKHLCLGICGEFLLAIENWVKKSLMAVKSYSCGISFDEFENNDPKGAKTKAEQESLKWIEAIKKKSSSEITFENIDGRGKAYVITLKEGIVKIITPQIMIRNYIDGSCQSANVLVMTESFDALKRILLENPRKYWTLCWVLPNDFDALSAIAFIDELRGGQVSGSKSIVNGVLTGKSSTYFLHRDQIRSIRVDVSGGTSSESKMVLVYDSNGSNKGFTHALEVLNPNLILSFLYGKVTPQEFRKLIDDSCL